MKRITAALFVLSTAIGCNDRPTAPIASASAANASASTNESANQLDIAVIGDTPYGPAAIALFPEMVAAINADPKIREVVHVGDFKSGSEQCSDARFQTSADLFATFKDPMIYAIGDNEWTDCNRTNNGGYNPLERLAKVRSMFYPIPGQVLGGRGKTVEAQPSFPENQLWVESRVTFSVSHIIGSNNGLEKWFFDRKVNGVLVPETAAEGASREAEVAARQAANLAWLEHTFATARAEGSVGIVMILQADLWHPGDRAGGAKFTAHQQWVERFAQLAATFNGKILMLVGDSHDYRVDVGVPWMATYYGVTAPANVTQVVVDRSIESPATDVGRQSQIEWVRVHIDPRSPAVFTWEQVITR
jgi:hypothetical protein